MKDAYQLMYKAIVVSTDDPTNSNLIKIRIPDIHGFNNTTNGVSDKDLPWAQYCSSTRTVKDYPKKDDIVFILFERGSHSSPVILGYLGRS